MIVGRRGRTALAAALALAALVVSSQGHLLLHRCVPAGGSWTGSALSLAQMRPRLDAGTPWTWWEGDSAWFDYLGARIGPGPRMLRLYPEPPGFVLQVRRGPMDPDLRAQVLETVLPLLAAEGVTAVEGLD